MLHSMINQTNEFCWWLTTIFADDFYNICIWMAFRLCEPWHALWDTFYTNIFNHILYNDLFKIYLETMCAQCTSPCKNQTLAWFTNLNVGLHCALSNFSWVHVIFHNYDSRNFEFWNNMDVISVIIYKYEIPSLNNTWRNTQHGKP